LKASLDVELKLREKNNIQLLEMNDLLAEKERDLENFR
jgi:hypothetical protein